VCTWLGVGCFVQDPIVVRQMKQAHCHHDNPAQKVNNFDHF